MNRDANSRAYGPQIKLAKLRDYKRVLWHEGHRLNPEPALASCRPRDESGNGAQGALDSRQKPSQAEHPPTDDYRSGFPGG